MSEAANPLTSFSVSSALNSFGNLSVSSSDLVKKINNNFSMIKFDTKPFDALKESMEKLKVVTGAIDFVKMSLDVAKVTTGIIANTMSTNLNTAAKNSEMVAEAKEIGLYLQVIGNQSKEMALKAKEIALSIQSTAIKAKDAIQTGLQTVATKVHTLAINSGIGARIKDIALYIQSLAMKAKDIIQTGLEIAAKAAHTVATNIATAAQAALNLVMSLNPIGIIIIAIVALIAAFTLLFLKCKPFHDWVISAFNNIRNVVLSVFGEIQAFITNSIDNIKQIFNGIIEFFTGVFTGNWKKAFQGLQDIVGGIFGQIVNVVKTPINIMIDLINGLIGNINNVIKLASNIPGIGGALKGVAIPKIPKLAHGGIIDSPTVAMLGEAGREAVVPLENTGFVTAIASAVASAVSSAIHGGSGTNGSGDVNVTLQVDRDVLGRATINAINSQIRRTGVIPLNI